MFWVFVANIVNHNLRQTQNRSNFTPHRLFLIPIGALDTANQRHKEPCEEEFDINFMFIPNLCISQRSKPFQNGSLSSPMLFNTPINERAEIQINWLNSLPLKLFSWKQKKQDRASAAYEGYHTKFNSESSSINNPSYIIAQYLDGAYIPWIPFDNDTLWSDASLLLYCFNCSHKHDWSCALCEASENNLYSL